MQEGKREYMRKGREEYKREGRAEYRKGGEGTGARGGKRTGGTGGESTGGRGGKSTGWTRWEGDRSEGGQSSGSSGGFQGKNKQIKCVLVIKGTPAAARFCQPSHLRDILGVVTLQLKATPEGENHHVEARGGHLVDSLGGTLQLSILGAVKL